MKHVIKRHAGDLQAFRSLAVAQAAAAADPKAEIFLECFEAHKKLVALAPAIKWKNPHHPYAVSERAKTLDSEGKQGSGRPGGKLYDAVIDLDPDTPLETEFLKSGLPWWKFISAKVKAQSEFGSRLKPANFPEIIDPPCPYAAPPQNYVVLAPLSRFANPRVLNVNGLHEFAKAQFPGATIYYISENNVFLGEGRNLLHYEDFVWLAWILKAATAVFAVNGLVSALAQSTIKGKRLVRKYCHIQTVKAGDAGRDSFLKYCAMMETELDRAAGEPACAIATALLDRTIKTERGFQPD